MLRKVVVDHSFVCDIYVTVGLTGIYCYTHTKRRPFFLLFGEHHNSDRKTKVYKKWRPFLVFWKTHIIGLKSRAKSSEDIFFVEHTSYSQTYFLSDILVTRVHLHIITTTKK